VSRPSAVLACLCACSCALALSACGTTSSTSVSAFSGVRREVAQTIANLQSDSNSSEEKKVCGSDLAGSLVSRLGGRKRCEEALKKQLAQVDNPELTIESVHVSAHGRRASATVKSIEEGKKRRGTLSLVREGGKWKIAGE
jgi:hypothetical protein